MNDALPFHFHLPVCLWIMDPHSKAPKKKMNCYRKIPCISYKDHVIREEVCAKIQQAIRPSEDLLTVIKRCKLKWYEHVSCSSGLAKTILKSQWKGEEDKVDGKRGGKTLGYGQALSLPRPRGQWRTGKNRGNWLQKHLWCPNNPHD